MIKIIILALNVFPQSRITNRKCVLQVDDKAQEIRS
jgi:hypothetical protein